MIVPNKFLKIQSGVKLRALLSQNNLIESIDDFGDSQIFKEQTIYSCILILSKKDKEFGDFYHQIKINLQ